MLKCPICGKSFDENEENGYTIFSSHVQKCAYDAELKKKTEDMKKINENLEELKRTKMYYESMRDDFKEKHPDVYKANFPEEYKFAVDYKDDDIDLDEFQDSCTDCSHECGTCYNCCEGSETKNEIKTNETMNKSNKKLSNDEIDALVRMFSGLSGLQFKKR